MKQKKIKGFLVIDWKKESMKASKRKPNTIKPSDIVIQVEINVKTPEEKIHRFKGDITIPEAKYDEMIIDEL